MSGGTGHRQILLTTAVTGFRPFVAPLGTSLTAEAPCRALRTVASGAKAAVAPCLQPVQPFTFYL